MAKTGFDDFLVAHGPDAFRRLLTEAIDPVPLKPYDFKEPATKLDPAIEARLIMEAGMQDEVYKLRYWRGEFYYWRNGCYQSVPMGEIRAKMIRVLNERWTQLGISKVADVRMHIEALGMLPGEKNSPTWIVESGDWKPPAWDLQQTIVCGNMLVNLPLLLQGGNATMPNTPRLFATSVSGINYNPLAPCPKRWLQFLHEELWPNDIASIELLQEWFGLCLVTDMSKEKMLMLIGPKRSGKSKIATILAALVGELSVCAPSLSSLGSQFGLWPFMNKTLAIVGDARIGARADHAMIAETLLKISGQDPVDVHRKNLDSVRNVKLQSRVVVISNEPPRLLDQSGALAGRFLTLQLTQSFYGREDLNLERTLRGELEGILLWAIEGWKRLNKRGRFIEPESGRELAAQLEEITSPISSFVDQHCIIDPDEQVDVPDLYEAYQRWCHSTGREPTNDSVFGRDLQTRFPSVKRRQRGASAGRMRFYQGIKLSSGPSSYI